MYSRERSNDENLDALFRAFRAACPDRDPSANFMPGVWQRIEARQSFTFSFHRMANGFVTAAVALMIALGLYMSIPHRQAAPNSPLSYLEALADANSLDTPEIVGPVRLDLSESAQ
jgi:hypothetical protein